MKAITFARAMILAALVAVHFGALAQLRATSSKTVTKSITVRTLYDLDNGYSQCKSALNAMCDDQTYSCGYGVDYYQEVADVTATYRGTTSMSGISYKHYDCRGTCTAVCNDPAPPPGPTPQTYCDSGVDDNECTSPILVDLGAASFVLTDAANGVAFDVNADGTAERVSWTGGRTDDAFLALDRNGDGAITSGAELFGNFTPQPSSAAPNGYEALRVFDDLGSGGNADGVITHDDAVWWSLRLWIDASHDGVSQPDELFTLDDLGIEALDLDYVESRHQDRYGNTFRYKAAVLLAGPGQRRTRSADVFLRTE